MRSSIVANRFDPTAFLSGIVDSFSNTEIASAGINGSVRQAIEGLYHMSATPGSIVLQRLDLLPAPNMFTQDGFSSQVVPTPAELLAQFDANQPSNGCVNPQDLWLGQ